MKNSKLYEFLISLSSEDWKSLYPFLNHKIKKGSDLNVLMDHIYHRRNNIHSDELETHYIHNRYFKNKSRKSVLNLYSELTHFVKDYLIIDQLDHDPYYKQVLLLQALNQRQLYKQAESLRTKTSNKLKTESVSWWNSLYQQLLDHHFYFSDNPKTRKKKPHIILASALHSITTYHNQLRSLYHFEVQNSIANNKLEYNDVFDDYNQLVMKENHLVSLFGDLSKIRMNHDEESTKRTKEYFYKAHNELSQDIRLIVYIVLRMHYSRKANLGDLSMSDELFSLNKIMVDNDYLIYDNQIGQARFMPIVELAAFMGEIEWGRKFIKNYSDKLPPRQKRETIILAESYMLFASESYIETLHNLNLLYPKNNILKSMIYRLQLITYLETGFENAIFMKQKIENYRLFIYRNKKTLSSKAYKASINLVKILKLIVERNDIELIEEKLKDLDLVFYRLYLFSKLKKLKSAQN